MQNRAKLYKISEEIDFEPVQTVELDAGVPAKCQEARKPGKLFNSLSLSRHISFRPSKIAVSIGQGLGYVLVGVLVLFGQVVWFFAQVLSACLHVLVSPLVRGGQETLSEFMSRRKDKYMDKDKDIDWRDIPIGQGRTRTKTWQGNENHVHINVQIKN